MKLDNVIEKTLGANKAKTIDKARSTIRYVLKRDGETLKLRTGSDFYVAIKKVMRILDKLCERKYSKSNPGYKSCSEFYRGMITKGYDYLTDNADASYIEKAIFNIGAPRLLEFKKELDGKALRMRRAVNELSESFEDHWRCVEKIKIQIQVEEQNRQSKRHEKVYSGA